MRKLFIFFTLVLVTLVFTSSTYAIAFNLVEIGGVKTNSQKAASWTTPSQRPTFKGFGDVGANVDVSIDGKFYTVKVDDVGYWSFTPAANLTFGTHKASVGTGGTTYAFNLIIGNATEVVPVGSGSGTLSKGGLLPQAGSLEILIGLTGIAALFLIFGLTRRKSTA